METLSYRLTKSDGQFLGLFGREINVVSSAWRFINNTFNSKELRRHSALRIRTFAAKFWRE
jgi:hypothetical protein